MTDPQNDKPCRDCGAPTQHDTERCDDCRTPAGRLVTALMDLNIDAEIDGRFVNVGCLIVDTNDEGMWSIDGHEEDGITAADAIAAIKLAAANRGTRIPYTKAGFETLVAGARSVFRLAERVGHLVEGSTVFTVPDLASISNTDRTNRRFTFSATATLAGGIRTVTFNGYLTA